MPKSEKGTQESRRGSPNLGVCDAAYGDRHLEHLGCGGKFVAPSIEAHKTHWVPIKRPGVRFRCTRCGQTLGRRALSFHLQVRGSQGKAPGSLRYADRQSIEIVRGPSTPVASFARQLVKKTRKASLTPPDAAVVEEHDQSFLFIDRRRATSLGVPKHTFSLRKLLHFRDFVNTYCTYFTREELLEFFEQEAPHLMLAPDEALEPPPIMVGTLTRRREGGLFQCVIPINGIKCVMLQSPAPIQLDVPAENFLNNYGKYLGWVADSGNTIELALRRQAKALLNQEQRAVSSSGRASGFHPEGGRFESGTALQHPSPIRCYRCGSGAGESLEGRCRDCGAFDTYRAAPNQTPEGWYQRLMENNNEE